MLVVKAVEGAKRGGLEPPLPHALRRRALGEPHPGVAQPVWLVGDACQQQRRLCSRRTLFLEARGWRTRARALAHLELHAWAQRTAKWEHLSSIFQERGALVGMACPLAGTETSIGAQPGKAPAAPLHAKTRTLIRATTTPRMTKRRRYKNSTYASSVPSAQAQKHRRPHEFNNRASLTPNLLPSRTRTHFSTCLPFDTNTEKNHGSSFRLYAGRQRQQPSLHDHALIASLLRRPSKTGWRDRAPSCDKKPARAFTSG